MFTPILQAGSGSLSRLPTHRNPGLEMVFIERGHLLWHVNHRRQMVGPGSVFFSLPWEEHGSISDYEPGHHWHFAIFNVGKRATIRKEQLTSCPVFGEQSAVGSAALKAIRLAPVRCYPASDRLAFLLIAAAAEFTRAQPNPVVLSSIARWSICELAEVVVKNQRHPTREVGNPSVRAFLERLPDDLEKSWTLAEMASACGLGRTHFANLVRKATGDTPTHFLQRLRAEQARQLLLTTDASITTIAIRCGFASSQHFARVFKAFFGSTASALRRGPQHSVTD